MLKKELKVEILMQEKIFLNTMMYQKQAIGLLGGSLPLKEAPALIPIIAAPDDSPDWHARWSTATARIGADLKDALGDVQFWRVSDTGEVLAMRSPTW